MRDEPDTDTDLMRTRLARLVIVVLVLAGSLLTGEQPASATAAGAAWFIGHMSTPAGMGDRCMPGSVLPDCLFATGSTGPFAFGAEVCVASGVATDAGSDVPIVPAVCVIYGVGTLTGFCGSASGTGDGVLTLLDPLLNRARTYYYRWQMTWVGSQYTSNTMLLTGVMWDPYGGDAQGSIVGRFSMTPITGTCTNHTATEWSIEAETAFELLPPA